MEINTPEYLQKFPYVNGGLFRDILKVPTFTTKSRNILIEIGQLQWSQINPDIFGSMIQAVVTPDHRGNLGMHYTSVPNIMKVIEPLFLDELYLEFEKAYENKSKLQMLLNRLAKIKIFDPACGSGNFLIIAYKKLRQLEMSIMQRIDSLSKEKTFQFSEIKLTQFYGIELDDFAHEVAMLSLWLAEHQMNLEFYKAFGRTSPSLPLQNGGNIVHGNATRLNWEEVCPKNVGDEIYILGNPPYLGSSMQNKEQKIDKDLIFKGIKNYKNLDYIACWFYIGAKYIKSINAKLAFVTTNSISQGEQVEYLWSHILEIDIEIHFAHCSFKWQNNAKSNANVIVSIIGLGNISTLPKYIFRNNIKYNVSQINPYLLNAPTVIIKKMQKPISKLPIMVFGDAPKDGGYLILSTEEKDNLISENSEVESLIKKYIGAYEYLNGKDRWCLWIDDERKLQIANSITKIYERFEKVKENRLASPKVQTQEFAKVPHRFVEIRYQKTDSTLIIPVVTSERREYIPIGFIDGETIITNASVIYNAEAWNFGVISSSMHMAWMRTVAGRLKTDYRYSSVLCYNTFPFPNISQKQKDEITELVFAILDEREKHSQKTLAQLYDPDKMPEGLKKTHHNLDIAIEQCYRSKLFESDEERLEYLFKMYEEMISNEIRK